MLTVLMPSRGRERQAREAYAAFLETKALRDTEMLVVLDEGEAGYEGLPTIEVAHAGGMGPALNAGLAFAAPAVYGFIGDDHRFQTPGWDIRILRANSDAGGAIVYGNDLLRGAELPTAVFMDARIVNALGWMALPGATHLFFDDTWRELGLALGRLRYLPDVIIEHLHPTAGKAEWDEGYLRVNAGSMYEHDAAVYHRWRNEVINSDVQRIEAALR